MKNKADIISTAGDVRDGNYGWLEDHDEDSVWLESGTTTDSGEHVAVMTDGRDYWGYVDQDGARHALVFNEDGSIDVEEKSA